MNTYFEDHLFSRGGSRAAAISKMECFVIIMHIILDVVAALDPPLHLASVDKSEATY